MAKKMDLSNPITSYANKLASLFKDDKGVTTKFYFFSHVLKIYFEDAERAQALVNIVKTHFAIGKLCLDVKVYKADGTTKTGKTRYTEVKPIPNTKGVIENASNYAAALGDNPYFHSIVRAKDPTGIVWYFVLMMPYACQYLNDDIQNPWSTTSVLPQDIIKKMFNHKSLQVSTVPEDIAFRHIQHNLKKKRGHQ